MLRNTKCRAAAGSYRLRITSYEYHCDFVSRKDAKVQIVCYYSLTYTKTTNDCEVFLQFFVLAIRYLPFAGCWLFVEAALGVGLFYLLEFLPT